MTDGDITMRWRSRAAAPGAVLLDGFHAVKHALRFGAEVDPVLAADRSRALALAASLAPDVVADLAARLVEVPPGTLAALAGGAHPTGVAGLARRPDPPPAGLPRAAPLVVLDQPRHLGNVGAVVRVAAGLGASGVAVTGTVDPWHPTVLRGSAGLHFALPVCRLPDPARLAGPLLVLDPTGRDLRTVRIPDGAALVFGSERHGVCAAFRARADLVAALPMHRLVSSYNLATSVAMTLYHWTLQPLGTPAPDRRSSAGGP
jgi:tRNA G18 (ribose-2'-O)-methylase SpoU